MPKTKRVFYFDVLRVIACLCVIMIHASSKYVSENIGSLNFWTGNILDGFARIGVPLFVMISGALMLDRNYNFTTKKLTGHITKMILFFVFWSAFYCAVFQVAKPLLFEHKSIEILSIAGSFIKGYFHLWYVYLIVGLYLIVPLLRLWVNDENKKWVEYFLVLSLIFTFAIPMVIETGTHYSKIFEQLDNIFETKMQLKYVGGFTAYFILGWYLNNYEIKYKKVIYALGIAGLLVSVFGTYFLSVSTGEALQLYGNLNVNILFQSVAVFVFIKDRFKNREKENKVVSSVAKYSLGIYAAHVMIILIANETLDRLGWNFAPVNIPAVFALSFILSYACAFVLSKIPLLKKVV